METAAAPQDATTGGTASAAALPKASVAVMAEMDAEHAAAIAANKHSTIDPDKIVTKHTDVRRDLERGGQHLEPNAPEEMPGYLAAYDAAWADADRARKAHLSGTKGTIRYSVQCRKASDQARQEVVRFRKRVSDRVTTPGAVPDDCRLRAGVGGRLPEGASPVDVSNAGNLQLELLADPEAFAFLDSAGCFPARVRKRLAPLIKKVDEEIDKGVGEVTRTGEASVAMDRALLKMQIVLSRAETFFDEFGNAEDSQKVESDVPRRYHARATDPQPTPEPPAPGPEQPAPAPQTQAMGEEKKVQVESAATEKNEGKK